MVPGSFVLPDHSSSTRKARCAPPDGNIFLESLMRTRLGFPSFVAAFAFAGFCMGSASAQYVGPSENTVAQNVKGILDKPEDDQMVTLQGHLLRKTGNEKYIFSDGTGEIVAEIDDDEFPAERVDDKTRVEIYGEVDTGLRRPPEIEVEIVRVLGKEK
jgi:uncharacterized protein (TIGR00156 family)